jgi:3-hydroxybutyryl-CoA dehydrogenase
MEVVLIDIEMGLVEKGVQRIDARAASDVEKGKLGVEEKDRLLARIRGSVNQQDASDSELVIEAVIENESVKGELFRSLDSICPKETVFATNTSTLSVTHLGAASGRPGRFVGLHFFNPVHVMKLVEVIPGLDTDGDLVNFAMELMKSIRKTPIAVQDCPGFLVNRVLLSYIGEALLCVQQGTPPEEIDGQARGALFPHGPP